MPELQTDYHCAYIPGTYKVETYNGTIGNNRKKLSLGGGSGGGVTIPACSFEYGTDCNGCVYPANPSNTETLEGPEAVALPCPV